VILRQHCLGKEDTEMYSYKNAAEAMAAIQADLEKVEGYRPHEWALIERMASLCGGLLDTIGWHESGGGSPAMIAGYKQEILDLRTGRTDLEQRLSDVAQERDDLIDDYEKMSEDNYKLRLVIKEKNRALGAIHALVT
jgi:hypothetical protein